MGDVLASCYVAAAIREPTHELDAVNLALLVETTRRDDLDQALSDLPADWKDGWSYACPARYGPVRLHPAAGASALTHSSLPSSQRACGHVPLNCARASRLVVRSLGSAGVWLPEMNLQATWIWRPSSSTSRA